MVLKIELNFEIIPLYARQSPLTIPQMVPIGEGPAHGAGLAPGRQVNGGLYFTRQSIGVRAAMALRQRFVRYEVGDGGE